jgi:hypothetical protein
MNSRHLLYVTYTLCFLQELKDKDQKSYEELENSNLNIPIPIFCKILDGIFYYKSYPYVFKALYTWQIDSEEKKLRGVPSLNQPDLEMHHAIKEKANTLANWSKEWSRRFNKE